MDYATHIIQIIIYEKTPASIWSHSSSSSILLFFNKYHYDLSIKNTWSAKSAGASTWRSIPLSSSINWPISQKYTLTTRLTNSKRYSSKRSSPKKQLSAQSTNNLISWSLRWLRECWPLQQNHAPSSKLNWMETKSVTHELIRHYFYKIRILKESMIIGLKW